MACLLQNWSMASRCFANKKKKREVMFEASKNTTAPFGDCQACGAFPDRVVVPQSLHPGRSLRQLLTMFVRPVMDWLVLVKEPQR